MPLIKYLYINTVQNASLVHFFLNPGHIALVRVFIFSSFNGSDDIHKYIFDFMLSKDNILTVIPTLLHMS